MYYIYIFEAVLVEWQLGRYLDFQLEFDGFFYLKKLCANKYVPKTVK